ncbi:hypothetical protein VTK26DRAFT_2024 [Humicola hyalothermophila]
MVLAGYRAASYRRGARHEDHGGGKGWDVVVIASGLLAGPFALLAHTILPGIGWSVRRLGRLTGWSAPLVGSLLVRVLPWLGWALRMAASCLWFLAGLVWRLFWGASEA